jgi:hypothetical protein
MNALRLLTLLLVSLAPLHAGTLHVTVLDLQGAVIPNAHAVVHWDSVGLDGVTDNIGMKTDQAATSDATGSFSSELPPGVYDLFVAAPGFFPHSEKITLGKENKAYEVRLKASRMLVTKLD